MTLRHAIRPVLKLAADVDTPNGCSLYALVRETSRRKATQSTDKVAGLVYLLRLEQLPTYDEKASDNDVWKRCFHMLPLARKIELLFDFPYRSAEQQQQWFPTWSELMTWPEINLDCDYSPARQPEAAETRWQDLVDLTESEEFETAATEFEGSLFMSDIWALSHCDITRSPAQSYSDSIFKNSTHPKAGGVDYSVSVKLKGINKIYGFYSPYDSQEPIETMSAEGQQYEFTIATADLGNSNNWVVCKAVKRLKARCDSTSESRLSELAPENVQETCESGKTLQESSEIEIEVLRKVGVLRTDFCGAILAGLGVDSRGHASSTALRRIHALFV